MRKINKDIIKKYNLFPLAAVEKYLSHPIIKWSEKENQIIDDEKFDSLKNITGACLLTGKPSGVMTIDLDNHAGGESGTKTFNQIWAETPNTLIVETPNKGIHLHFKYREGLKSIANIWPGVDIKTDGGLIMMPGSQKKKEDGSIGCYEVILDTEILEMPEVLFQKILKKQNEGKKGNKKTCSDKTGVSVNMDAYPKGQRNEGLFRDGISFFSRSITKDYTTILTFLQGLNLMKCQPPLEIKEVEKIAKSVSENIVSPKFYTPDGKVIPFALVRHIMKERPCFSRGNLTFFYNDQKGFYEHTGAQELYNIYFENCFNDLGRTASKAKDFAETMLMVASEEIRNYEEKKFANCLNGTVNLETRGLMPFSNKHRLTSQFQANYRDVPDSEFKNSRFKRFLDEILDSGSQLTLQEALGLMISPHAQEVQQAFVFLGNGKNGKSALMEIMQALIGSNDYISSIGLSDFSKDFDISQAEGKIANIVMDDDLTAVRVGAAFKSMICGESTRVNRKNKDIKVMAFNMTHFFNLNRLPSASDKSDGFYRRFCIIPFNNTFGTEEDFKEGKTTHVRNPSVTKEIIQKELDIIFHWGLQGLFRLKLNNWKLTISKAAIREMETFKEDSDSAYAFFKDCMEICKGNSEAVSAVVSAYDMFCGQNGINKPMGGRALGKQLKSFGIKQYRTNSARFYKDIKIKN